MNTRKTHRHFSGGLVVATLAASLVANFAVGAMAFGKTTSARQTSEATQLRQGLNYFAGKAITFISPEAAGGQADLLSRDFANYMGQYLHATINVEDISAGNGAAANDVVAASNPNGMTIGFLNPGQDIGDEIFKTAGPNFNPAREAFLGATEAAVSTWWAKPGSGLTSLSSIEGSSGFNFVVAGTGSNYQHSKLLAAIFGIHANFITSYNGAAAALAGWERGDGPVTAGSLATYGPLDTGGQAIPVLISGNPPKGVAYGSLLSNVPTYAKAWAAIKHPTAEQKKLYNDLNTYDGVGGYVMFGPTKLPNDEVLALRAAATWAGTTASAKSLMLSQGLVPGLIPGTSVKAYYLKMENLIQSIAPIITGA